MAIETRQALNPFRCIEDLEFQKELVELGVIVQGDLNSDRWALKPTRLSTMNNYKKLVAYLAEMPGFVRPNDCITTGMFDEDSPRNRNRLKTLVTDTTKKIADPTSIYRVWEVGVGLGIERFNIAPLALSLLYRTYQSLGNFVSVDEVSCAVFGNNSENNLHNTYLKARILATKYLNGTNAQLENAYIGDRRFLRLSDRRFLPKYMNKKNYAEYPDFPKHLQPAFQNWLINYLRLPRKADDDQLALKLPPEKWTKEGSAFNPYEQKMAEMLCRFPRYVISAEKMAEYVLGKPLSEDWADLMHSYATGLRKKVKPNINIYCLERVGWSIGISNIGLTEFELISLSELWEHFNNGVSGKQLAKRLYGSSGGRNVEKARLVVDVLKDDLEVTDYSIGYMHSLTGKSGFTPALIANQNIIGKPTSLAA
jgi:hypothetical protein